MKQKTIATRHLRTKIAAGYVLILFVIFGIVYIWLNEQHRRQELEITSQKIRCLRKDIHEVYVKMVDLSPCRRICTNKANVPADLQSAGIEYKDFQSACFLLLFNRYEFRIADPYIFCCRITYPTEH